MKAPISKKARLTRYIPLTNKLLVDNGIGNIDGVGFNICHDSLDHDEWAKVFIIQNFCYLPNEEDDGVIFNRHKLWFPWFGPFRLEKIRSALTRLSDFALKSRIQQIKKITIAKFARSQMIDELAILYSPSQIIHAGDTVTVSHTRNQSSGNNFLHLHDTDKKLVFLSILSPDGIVVNIEEPYEIIGSRNILPIDDDEVSDAFSAILFRIVKAVNVPTPADLRRFTTDNKELALAIRLASEIFELTDAAWDDPDRKKPFSIEDVEDAEYLLDLANDAALLGFLWGKLEADKSLRPLADGEIIRKERSSVGGKNSAIMRRQTAKIKWMDPVETMAHEIRQEEPGISQDRLVDEISFRWKSENKLPGHPRLKIFISQLERSHALPKRMPRAKK